MIITYKKVDYTNIEHDTPNCQCGTKMELIQEFNRLICSNKNCIKKRVQSVINMLRALDRLTDNTYELERTALNNYYILTRYVEKYDIQTGAEIITLGNSLAPLGVLGQNLCEIIDNTYFNIKDLSKICGSAYTDKFNIDFTRVAENNERKAWTEINRQLGIEGTIMLAKLLYEEYTEHKTEVFSLADYLTLIRHAKQRRQEDEPVVNSHITDALTELQINVQNTDTLQNITHTAIEEQSIPNDIIEEELTDEDEKLLAELNDW